MGLTGLNRFGQTVVPKSTGVQVWPASVVRRAWLGSSYHNTSCRVEKDDVLEELETRLLKLAGPRQSRVGGLEYFFAGHRPSGCRGYEMDAIYRSGRHDKEAPSGPGVRCFHHRRPDGNPIVCVKKVRIVVVSITVGLPMAGILPREPSVGGSVDTALPEHDHLVRFGGKNVADI